MTEQLNTSQTAPPLFIQLQNEKKAAMQSAQHADEERKRQYAKERQYLRDFVEKTFEELKILVPAEIGKTMNADPALVGTLFYQCEKFFVAAASNITNKNIAIHLNEPQYGQDSVPVLSVRAGGIAQETIGKLHAGLAGFVPVLRMDNNTFTDAKAIKKAMITYLVTGKF